LIGAQRMKKKIKSDVAGKITSANIHPQTIAKHQAKVILTAPHTSHVFDAFEVFKISITRADNLLRIHKAAHGKKSKPERYLADAHRAVIVLAISALDAYVRTLFIEKIRELLVDGKEIPVSLESRIKSYLKEDGLLEAARKGDLLGRVEKAIQNDFDKKSFQGCKIIEEYLEMAGIKNVFKVIAEKANMNETLLRTQLDSYTNRRHLIAHRGDHDLTKNPPEETEIKKDYAINCIKLIRKIVNYINSLR
jgi:hypothetical protein